MLIVAILPLAPMAVDGAVLCVSSMVSNLFSSISSLVLCMDHSLDNFYVFECLTCMAYNFIIGS